MHEATPHPLQDVTTLLCLFRAGCGPISLVRPTFDQDVVPLLSHLMNRDELQLTYDEARRVLLERDLARRRTRRVLAEFRQSPTGEALASRVLCLRAWPDSRRTWAGIVIPRLVALALGCCHDQGLARIATASGLRREILRMRLGIEVNTKRVNPGAVQEQAARAVGAEGTSIPALRTALLRQAVELLAISGPYWPDKQADRSDAPLKSAPSRQPRQPAKTVGQDWDLDALAAGPTRH